MSEKETDQEDINEEETDQVNTDSEQQHQETDQVNTDSEQQRQPRHDEVFCSSCGSIIKKEAEVCTECGVPQNKNSGNVQKNPGVAAILSFLFGGGGQIYNGQIGKGIAIILIQMVNVGLMFVVIGFITWPATAIWSVYDAYKTAGKINDGEISA